MASSSSSWMPFHGTHQVSIGTSLRRALKARKNKGEPPAPAAGAKRLPDRDFYAFRYNFKPTSIDPEKPGGIDVRKSTDSTQVTVEYPSKQKGETHVFRGSENVAKEWDCVLIYDEELGTFTLEKLDSHVALMHERKRSMGARPPPPADPQSSSHAKEKDDSDAQLEKDLLELTAPEPIPKREQEANDLIEGVVTKPIKPSKQPPPSALLQRRRPPAPAKVPTKQKQPQPPRAEEPPPPPKAKGKASAVPLPTYSSTSAKPPSPLVHPLPPKPKSILAPPPPPPATTQQAKPPTRKRELEPTAHVSDAEEEVLEFGRPAQPAKKRARKASSAQMPAAPLPTSGLALPGTSSVVAPPPPIPGIPSSSRTPSAAAAAGVTAGGNASESEEEDWSEVEPDAVQNEDDVFGDNGLIEGEEEDQGEDIDLDEFEQEINMEMEEMDEDEDGMMVEADVSALSRRDAPMSLNDYARDVAGVGMSDDDTTSSEDSDDD